MLGEQQKEDVGIRERNQEKYLENKACTISCKRLTELPKLSPSSRIRYSNQQMI